MTITTIYNQAELALAAYANLLSGSTSAQENITNLQQGGDGMSAKQAEEFAREKGDATIFSKERRSLCHGRRGYWCQITRTI